MKNRIDTDKNYLHKLFKISIISFAFFVAFMFFAAGTFFSASAQTIYESESNDYIDDANYFTIGSTIKGNSSNYNDVDFYKFVLTKGGMVSFDFKCYVDRRKQSDSKMTIFDSDGEELHDGCNHFIFYNDNVGFGKDSYSFMLQPGTYYIKMKIYQDDPAEYIIQSSFVPSNQTFCEPDAYLFQAHKISIDKKVYGQIDTYCTNFEKNSWDRDYDLYSFSINKKTTLDFSYSMKRDSYNHDIFTVQIFDADMENEVYRSSSFNKQSKVNRTERISLSKGTYYVAFTGDPRDMITYSFSVKPVVTKTKQIKTVKLSKTSFAYTGKSITPKVTAKDTDGKVLKLGKDYTVKYANNKKVGKATVVVTFKGDYKGKKTLSFKIIPATPKVTVTSGKKMATVKWKAAKGAQSYTVYYSTSKNSGFKKAGTTENTSFKVKNLKSGKIYYFKVVASKKVGKTDYNSLYSSVQKVKIK